MDLSFLCTDQEHVVFVFVEVKRCTAAECD